MAGDTGESDGFVSFLICLYVPDGQQRGEDDHTGDDGQGTGQGRSLVVAAQFFGVDGIHGTKGRQEAERSGLLQFCGEGKQGINQQGQCCSHYDAGTDGTEHLLHSFLIEGEVQIQAQHEHGQEGIGVGCRCNQGEHEFRELDPQKGQNQKDRVDLDGDGAHDALEEAQEGELGRTGHETTGHGVASAQSEEGVGRVVETGCHHAGRAHEALQEGQGKASDVVVGIIGDLVGRFFVSALSSGEPGNEDHGSVGNEGKQQEEEQGRIQGEVPEGCDDGAGERYVDVDRTDYAAVTFLKDLGLF